MHKRGRAQLIWGGLLIPLGLLLLAESLDWLGDLNASFWSLTLAAVSLVFLTTFHIQDSLDCLRVNAMAEGFAQTQ